MQAFICILFNSINSSIFVWSIFSPFLFFQGIQQLSRPLYCAFHPVNIPAMTCLISRYDPAGNLSIQSVTTCTLFAPDSKLARLSKSRYRLGETMMLIQITPFDVTVSIGIFTLHKLIFSMDTGRSLQVDTGASLEVDGKTTFWVI